MSRLLFLMLLGVLVYIFAVQVFTINDGLTDIYGTLERLGNGVSLERLADVARQLGQR